MKKLQNHLLMPKFFLPDQLISIYGGLEYSDYQGNYRLTLFYGNQIDHLFVKKGDLLVLEEGRWKLSQGETQNKPLAKIESIQGSSVELVLWDEEGISSANLFLPVIVGSSFSAPMPEVFRKLYKRTETSVMCDLSGKSTIIRKGDWVIKQGKKWRSLRSVNDLKDFLGYVLKGELFIFDGIEIRDGSNYFTGHYFNNERTQVLKVDLKLNDKSQKKKNPSKNNKLRRARLIPSDIEEEGAAL